MSDQSAAGRVASRLSGIERVVPEEEASVIVQVVRYGFR